jgi:hypothetical protein
VAQTTRVSKEILTRYLNFEIPKLRHHQNFCAWGLWQWHRQPPQAQSFFASFCSQKEDLASL